MTARMEEGRRKGSCYTTFTAHVPTQPQSLSTWRRSRNNEIRSTDKDREIQQNNKAHFSNFTQQQFSHSSIQRIFLHTQAHLQPFSFFPGAFFVLANIGTRVRDF